VRDAAAGAGVAAAVAAALFAPFLLTGEFRMFDYGWEVSGATFAGLVLEPGSDFVWAFRLAQAAVAVAAGVAVARRLGWSPLSVPAALLAAVTVRLALDPALFSWYWVSPLALVLVLAAGLVTSPWFAAAARGWSRRGPALPMETP
jgi:hypothetical protein